MKSVQSERDTTATISGRLAEFAASLRYEDLPADIRDLAQLALLDTLGCGLAGSVTEELRSVRSAMAQAGGAGDTLFWGTADRGPLPLAALVNGAAAHAREMDDFGGCMHSGSVVIPAAFCTAARIGASGRELLAAIVAGYDLARRAMDGGGGYLVYKKRGWHSTSTCGGFGAAAAAGRLLRLDAEKLQWALGYAGSSAAGTWAYIADGAMSKRLHPGLAAQSGVISAYLAANNVTGPTRIFEAEWGGFFPTYSGDQATPHQALDGLGSEFRISIIGFKPYAACRGSHSSIDAILELRREHGIQPENVQRITVRGSSIHIRQLGKKDVNTIVDAQFSIPYCVAVALATGGAQLDQYSSDALRRPEIVALAHRVEVVRDERVADGDQPFVEVHMMNGTVVTKRVLIARGDYRNPLSEDELRRKFRTMAGLALTAAQVARLEQAISRMAKVENVGELAELLHA